MISAAHIVLGILRSSLLLLSAVIGGSVISSQRGFVDIAVLLAQQYIVVSLFYLLYFVWLIAQPWV